MTHGHHVPNFPNQVYLHAPFQTQCVQAQLKVLVLLFKMFALTIICVDVCVDTCGQGCHRYTGEEVRGLRSLFSPSTFRTEPSCQEFTWDFTPTSPKPVFLYVSHNMKLNSQTQPKQHLHSHGVSIFYLKINLHYLYHTSKQSGFKSSLTGGWINGSTEETAYPPWVAHSHL